MAGLVALAGCGGGSGIDVKRLRTLVLQPSDLPAAFTRFDFGKQGFGDFRPGPRKDRQRFGRVDGWKARYKRSGSTSTRGPLVVESFADLFDGDGGAKRDLDAYRAEFGETAGARLVEAPPLGEAAVAMTLRQVSGSYAVRFFTVAWRDRNVTASVSVNGFDGKLTLPQAVALARKQERRISRAR